MSRIADALSKTSEAHGRREREITTAAIPWDLEVATPEVPPTPAPAAKKDHAAPKPSAPVSVTFGPVDPRYEDKLVGSSSITPIVAERYRQLAATLYHDGRSSGARVIMITSALPGEGKTLLASNLALTLSSSYRSRVLLIDGDLRRPSLHSAFGVPVSPGVSDCFADGENRPVPIVQVSPTLSLVVAGQAQVDPMRIVAGTAFQRFIREDTPDYDWVILDTPPVALLTDANIMSSSVDRIILVVKASTTPYDAIQKAIDNVGRERIIGVVLNAAPDVLEYGPDYLSYYAASGTTTSG